MALDQTYLRDPLQGFDIKVSVNSYNTSNPVLGGVFTGFMCRITNQTEAYLPLNTRIPRMLDGEIIVAWHLEQGMVAANPVTNAFGQPFATALAKGRAGAQGTGANSIPRSQRFSINMEAQVAIVADAVLGEDTFASDSSTKLNLSLTLDYARIDTGSYGVVAGKKTASSAWQGTGQTITVVESAA